MSETAVAETGETSAAGGIKLSRAQMNLVFGTILLGLLLSALDQTVESTVSTALAGKFGGLFGREEAGKITAAWRARLMGELQGGPHHTAPDPRGGDGGQARRPARRGHRRRARRPGLTAPH